MYLDYSKITLDANGVPVPPVLRLQTLSGNTLGILNGVTDLSFNIGWAELSEISFTVPYMHDGIINPLYKDITGFKLIHTKNYGIYLVTSPSTEGDGLSEKKHVKGYSIEKRLERRNFFLPEGAYKLFDIDKSNKNAINNLLEETDSQYRVVCKSDSLSTRYAWFDQYKNNMLTFCYSDLLDKYRALAVFDPYIDPDTGKRTIYLYDADADVDSLPIYLSYANLVEQTEVSEISDELITKLCVYGADNLSIRDVNPTGQDYIVDLRYFIENGDMEPKLADKVTRWQNDVESAREGYTAIANLRAINTSKKLTLEAKLTDLDGRLVLNTEEQNAAIKALSLCDDEIPYQNISREEWTSRLSGANERIQATKDEIASTKSEIENIQRNIDGLTETMRASITKFSLTGASTEYFTKSDLATLSLFLIEDEITEETFVSTNVSETATGSYFKIMDTVRIEETEGGYTEMSDLRVYSITGGKLSVKYTNSDSTYGTLSGSVKTGAFDVKNGKQVTVSIFMHDIVVGEKKYPNGVLTLVSDNASIAFSGETEKDAHGDVSYFIGSATFNPDANGFEGFFTAQVNDYQKFATQTELYEYGQEILNERAFPTYEFSLDTANFLFQEEFHDFKDRLEFGKCIYLILGSHGRQEAPLIGVELDFSDVSSLSLTFSNRFQKHDGRAKLKDMIGQSYSSSRDFEGSRVLYKQAAKTSSEMTAYMSSSIDAAKNHILAANNLSVTIDGTGINVGGDGKYQLRIVDDMIAMTEDNWTTAGLAIGLILGPDGEYHYGLNADLLIGKLIIGNSAIIENTRTIAGPNGTSTTVVQFRVDENGVRINNGSITMENDAGGKLLIDPRYGFIAGTNDLYLMSEDGITPGFIDQDGNTIYDEDGMPEGANFYLNSATGEAFFRGEVVAGAGDIGGWQIGDNMLYSGTGSSYVALNANYETGEPYKEFAIWAGNANPNSSNFYVKRDGTVKVKGDLDASSFSINGETALDDADQITGDFLNLKGVLVGPQNDPNFYVDANGNVTIKGKITMGAGSSINWGNVTESNNLYSDAYSLANSANTTANTAKSTADAATLNADQAKARADAATVSVNNILYEGTTYIDGSKIYTGSITTNSLRAGTLEGFTIISEGNFGDIVIADSMIKLGRSGMLYGDDVGNMFVQAPESFRIYMGNYRYFEFSGAGINYYRSDDGGYTFNLISYAQFNPV